MLDLIFAKAKYAEELKASEPVLHKAEGSHRAEGRKQKADDQPSTVHRPSSVKLMNARHPLLDPKHCCAHRC